MSFSGLLCQQNDVSCKNLYPNCNSKALLSVCSMDNTYYCVEKVSEEGICKFFLVFLFYQKELYFPLYAFTFNIHAEYLRKKLISIPALLQ